MIGGSKECHFMAFFVSKGFFIHLVTIHKLCVAEALTESTVNGQCEEYVKTLGFGAAF